MSSICDVEYCRDIGAKHAQAPGERERVHCVPGFTAVGTIAQPPNFVDPSVCLSRFLALLMTLLLPSSGN